MNFTRLTTAVIMCAASLPICAASYTVTELPTQNLSQNQYAASIDDSGLMLTTTQNYFNLPIDVNLIDFENAAIIANLTDVESAKVGNFNLADYTYLVNRALTFTGSFSLFSQQLSVFLAFKTDGTSFDYINAFDTESESLGGFTYSMTTQPRDSVGGTHIIGNTVGPFRAIDYVNEAGDTVKYVVNDFDQRAFVQIGNQVVDLPPVEVSLGGSSIVSKINDNFAVAGSGSFSASAAVTVGLETCADPVTRGDQPEEACKRSFLTGQSGRRSGLWVQRAHIWSLDVDGNILDTSTYGTLLTEEGQELSGISQALDINNADVAVGVASVQLEARTVTATAATIFQNGEVRRIIEGDEFLPNSATNINDSGYIVGVQAKFINQAQRSKMFVYNMNNEELNFPIGFFTSSGTVPRAMNNANLVVGSGDIEAGNTSSRRSAAFVYDIEADTFLDLNTLISCENQSKYNLIEAVDINDSGDIVATALIKRASKNVTGTLIQDDNGENVIVDGLIAVKVSPTGAAPEICSNEELGIVERSGASTGFVLFGILFLASIFRRSTIVHRRCK